MPRGMVGWLTLRTGRETGRVEALHITSTGNKTGFLFRARSLNCHIQIQMTADPQTNFEN